MKYLTKITLFAVLLATLAGCSNKFYESKDLKVLKRKHRKVAVLPASIEMPGNAKKITTTGVADITIDKGFKYQQKLIELLNQQKDEMSVTMSLEKDVQSKLEGAYITYYELKTEPITKVGNALDVDGLIYTNINTPIFLGRDLGENGNKKIKVEVKLMEANNEELLWSYKDEYKASDAPTAEAIAERVYQKIKNKFPYKE